MAGATPELFRNPPPSVTHALGRAIEFSPAKPKLGLFDRLLYHDIANLWLDSYSRQVDDMLQAAGFAHDHRTDLFMETWTPPTGRRINREYQFPDLETPNAQASLRRFLPELLKGVTGAQVQEARHTQTTDLILNDLSKPVTNAAQERLDGWNLYVNISEKRPGMKTISMRLRPVIDDELRAAYVDREKPRLLQQLREHTTLGAVAQAVRQEMKLSYQTRSVVIATLSLQGPDDIGPLLWAGELEGGLAQNGWTQVTGTKKRLALSRQYAVTPDEARNKDGDITMFITDGKEKKPMIVITKQIPFTKIDARLSRQAIEANKKAFTTFVERRMKKAVRELKAKDVEQGYLSVNLYDFVHSVLNNSEILGKYRGPRESLWYEDAYRDVARVGAEAIAGLVPEELQAGIGEFIHAVENGEKLGQRIAGSVEVDQKKRRMKIWTLQYGGRFNNTFELTLQTKS